MQVVPPPTLTTHKLGVPMLADDVLAVPALEAERARASLFAGALNAELAEVLAQGGEGGEAAGKLEDERGQRELAADRTALQLVHDTAAMHLPGWSGPGVTN